MKFKLILPEPNFRLDAIEPTENFKYRWRARHFPFVVESPDKNPTNKCWVVENRIDYGKNRERTKKYPSSQRLQLRERSEEPPAHTLEWIIDSGKLAYYCQPSIFFSVMPGRNGGWLIVAINTKNTN